MAPTVHRTWAPKGQTPLLRQRTRSHKKVSGIGALSISPRRHRLGLYLHWHPDKNITQDEVMAFLAELLKHLRGQVILIWDRLNAHRSARLKQWRSYRRRLRVEWLPPYAPELNAMEYVWGHLKYHRLSNHGHCELEAIHGQAERETEHMAAQQSLLRSFVHATGLSIQLRK